MKDAILIEIVDNDEGHQDLINPVSVFRLMFGQPGDISTQSVAYYTWSAVNTTPDTNWYWL